MHQYLIFVHKFFFWQDKRILQYYLRITFFNRFWHFDQEYLLKVQVLKCFHVLEPCFNLMEHITQQKIY